MTDFNGRPNACTGMTAYGMSGAKPGSQITSKASDAIIVALVRFAHETSALVVKRVDFGNISCARRRPRMITIISARYDSLSASSVNSGKRSAIFSFTSSNRGRGKAEVLLSITYDPARV